MSLHIPSHSMFYLDERDVPALGMLSFSVQVLSPRASRPSSVLPPLTGFTSYTLADLTPRERELWLDGYLWGGVHGIEQERKRNEERDHLLWQEAVKVVHRMADLPPHGGE